MVLHPSIVNGFIMQYVITHLLLFTITDETWNMEYWLWCRNIFYRHCYSVSIFPQCTNDDCHRHYVYVLLKLMSKWVYARIKHVHGYSFPFRLRRIAMAILYRNEQFYFSFFVSIYHNIHYILFPVHLYYESLVAVFSPFTVDKFNSLTYNTGAIYYTVCLWCSVI